MLSTTTRTRSVEDVYLYWSNPPPQQSDRCLEWVKRIRAGWRLNRRICQMGYHDSTRFYGVWVWEYINVISPLLQELGAY